MLDNDKSHKSVSRRVFAGGSGSDSDDGLVMHVQAVGDETCWWPAFFDGEGFCRRL